MTIALQAGRHYKDRTGRVWGPIVKNDYEDTFPFNSAFEDKIYSWKSDGSYNHICCADSDLIEEVPAPEGYSIGWNTKEEPEIIEQPPVRLARDMTMREHIAAQVLAAYMADGGVLMEQGADYAVRCADALLAALDKKEGK